MPSGDEQNVETPKNVSFAKRDALREIELLVQDKWDKEKVFELDAPSDDDKREGYLGTFPYPYMNGVLHLGHGFTLSKVDFAVGFERLNGKNAIFPFGLHCTGMPIRSCADKIKYELETYGNPPQFPIREAPKPEDVQTEKKEKKKKDGKSKKSKSIAKTGGISLFQYEIMEGTGIPKEEISKFQDALYWLEYFPQKTMEDLKYMGARIDFRRSFITTDVNPYYDSFVRWQFLRLKEMGKVKFGKRFTIYSPKDNGPCLDHDRQSGEGVTPTEYVLVKQELLKPYPKVLKSLEDGDKKVYLVPATLRPETMYGQTNCWVLPDGEYGAFVINDKDIFICTERAALNLSFQGYSPKWGEIECVAKFTGREIIGSAAKAPFTPYEKIYVWPMFNVMTNKTTGVVTSVPSDAPHDYVAFRDVKNKKELRDSFGLTDEMVSPYELVPIIECPSLGDRCAETVVQQLKIKSQNDHVLLDEAKDMCYEKGFYEGVMSVGDYKGMKVESAKALLKQKLLDDGLAIVYAEPSDPVISRSGDTCVVALIDQWYLDYGETEWLQRALKCVEKMETYSTETRNLLVRSLNWMTQWACSRSYGLGTKVPWDEEYLIDSLSDSTIYMAYYTIAQYLQGDIYGKTPGLAGVKASSMTPEVYDYIFLGKDKPETDIPDNMLEAMRKEFKYWYPVSLRVTGKELVPNHLLFWIYNHVIFFGEDYWPKSVLANGHVKLNKEKMSKSTGNFITIRDGVDLFSADGMRFSLADSGDGLDDANFTTLTADNAVLKIYTLVEWVKAALNKDVSSYRASDSPHSFFDDLFVHEMNEVVEKTKVRYQKMEFKEALTHAFFDFQDKKDKYVMRAASANVPMHYGILTQWIRTHAIIMSPLCPHYTEYIWSYLLKEEGSVVNAKWPESVEIDYVKIKQSNYIESNLHQWRVKLQNYLHPKKLKPGESKPGFPSTMKVYIADSFPSWRVESTKLYHKLYKDNNNKLPEKKAIIAAISQTPALKKEMKKVMPVIEMLSSEYPIRGEEIFELELPYNEEDVVKSFESYINNFLEVKEIVVEKILIEDANLSSTAKSSVPGKPAVEFF